MSQGRGLRSPRRMIRGREAMRNRRLMSNPGESCSGGTAPPWAGSSIGVIDDCRLPRGSGRSGVRRLALLWALILVTLAAPAAAQTPAPETETPEPPPFPTWRVTDIDELAIDGQPVALSPDGRWIAGIGPDGGSICAWRLATLHPTCAGEDLRIQTLPLTGTIAWSPDSSAVAFVNGISQLYEPTDVMLFDVDTGILTNITLTAFMGETFIHTGPAWTRDGAWIVFAQTDPSGRRDQPASIIYYNRDYAVPVPVPLEDAFYITAPVVTMPDDSVLFRVEPTSDSNANAGIWRVDPDGENLRQVIPGEDDAPIDMPVVLDVSADGKQLSVASATAVARMDRSEAFFIVDVDSGDVRALDLPDDGEVISQPVFDVDQIYALVQDGAGPGASLLVMNADGDTQRLEGVRLQGSWLLHPPTWSRENTVLVPEPDGALLLTLDQAPGPPPYE